MIPHFQLPVTTIRIMSAPRYIPKNVYDVKEQMVAAVGIDPTSPALQADANPSQLNSH